MGTRNNLEPFQFGPRQVFDPTRFARPDLGLLPEPSFHIAPDERVFVLGSCFAARIRDALVARGVAASDGGLGLKYNAFSMLQALSWATEGEVDAELIVETRDGWVNPHHHPGTAFRRRAQAIDPFVRALERTQAEIPDAATFVFTLGLVEAWYDTLTDTWTNETPPVGSLRDGEARFRFHRTGFAANLLAVTEMVRLVHRVNPAARFVGTVSPIPLKASFASDDVLVANTYSKSTLRTVIDEAIETLRGEGVTIDYFPSYELVTLAPDRSVVWEDQFPDGSPDGRHVCRPFVNEVIVPLFLDRWLALPAARAAG